MTIPLTISSPPTTMDNLRVGLSIPSHVPQISFNLPSNSTTTSVSLPPPRSSPSPIITANITHAHSSPSSQTELVSLIPERASVIQGSRRRKATTPGKLSATALSMNGDEDGLVEYACKRIKTENVTDMNGCVNKVSPPSLPSSSINRSQTAMVYSVNGLMEALKCQQQRQQNIESATINISAAAPNSTTTPKVITAIMMAANSVKNLVSQLLVAAAAGHSRIEVGGASAATATPSTTAPLSGEQALDMSMRPTVETQLQLQAQMKSAELKLADLIQADQLQSSAANGLDALRSALTAQLNNAVMAPPPAGVQHITIGLQPSPPHSTSSIDFSMINAEAAKQIPFTSQLVDISQLQALILALAGAKSSQAPKDSLSEVISSRMLSPSSPSHAFGNVSASCETPLVAAAAAAVDGLNSTAMRFSSADLALATALTPPGTTNSLKEITLPTGEFIPMSSLIPGHQTGLGSFTLTSGGPPSSLTSFVSSLSGASTTSVAPMVTYSKHQTSPLPLPFDAALFEVGNPLNIVAQSSAPPSTSPIRTQSLCQNQSLNNGPIPPVSTVCALPKTDSPLSHATLQPLCETASCASLEKLATAHGGDGGGAGTDTDTSAVEAEAEEGLLSGHFEVTTEESGSPTSNTGARRSTSTSSKTCRRTSSGLSTRPHRQNFTALQNRILTDWYNSHHHKPYPSTEDTKMLAQKSDLTYPQVKKWFANKRARTSNNGLPKPLPPTAPDTPSTAAADTSAFVAAAVAAAAAANQSSLLSSGASGMMSQQAVTKTNSILVPSGLVIRPNRASLTAGSMGSGGFTILAPRPTLLSSQQPIVAIPPTSVTASPKPISPVAAEETFSSVCPSSTASAADEMQQLSTDPKPSFTGCPGKDEIKDDMTTYVGDEKIKEMN